MNIKELRLGNIVKRNDEFLKVDGYIFWHIEFPTDPRHKIELLALYPVHLNKEWLEKLGFEDDQITIYKKSIVLAPGDDGYDVWLCGLSGGKTTSIKYVHQLQNLFFIIEGEELIINL